MEIIRCGECGSRLNAGYCPMCMKRIPLTNREKEKPWRQRTYTPTREEEDHKCITFDTPAESPKKPVSLPKIKGKSLAGIIIAVVGMLISLIGNLAEDFPEDIAIPEIDHSAYIQAGSPGAEDVPGVDPMVLYEDGEITVTLDSAGLFYDDYALAVTVVNLSQRDICLNTELLQVNGYMLNSLSFYVPAGEGETVQDYLVFYSEDLAQAGIEEVSLVNFALNIYDDQDYSPVAYVPSVLLKTDSGYIQKVNDSGLELYNQNGVRILLKDTCLDDYGDWNATLYIENNTDDLVTVSDMGIWVNQEESNAMLWSILMPQTRAVEHVWVYGIGDLDIYSEADIREVFIDLDIRHYDAADPQSWIELERVDSAITFLPDDLI